METVSPFDLKVSVLENGSCHTLSDPTEAIRAFEDDQTTTWLHVVYRDREATADFLGHGLGFHDLAIEDALNDEERPNLHEYDDHLFLSAWKVISENNVERFCEMGFFITRSALVTVCSEELVLIDKWFERWSKAPDRVGKTPIEVMHSIIDSIVDEYYVVADAMEDEVDALIDDLYLGDNQQLRRILQLKRRLIELRRHITPVRDIMNGLLRRDIILVTPDARIYFQDVYDHTLRLAELADINRETLTSALDVHLSSVSNNLNNVMKKMTVISTVLMSGALIAGVYGMNFKHIPELEWIWGYPFAIFLMLLSGVAIVWLFRKKKWI